MNHGYSPNSVLPPSQWLDHEPLNINVTYYYHGHSVYEQATKIDLDLKVPFQKNHSLNTVIGLGVEGERRLREAARTYV